MPRSVSGDEIEFGESAEQLREAGALNAQQWAEVIGRDPGPVAEQVERLLLTDSEQRCERSRGCGDVRREPAFCQRPLARPLPCGTGVAEHFSQAEPRRSRRRPPDRITGPGLHGVRFERKNTERRRAPEQPSSLPQPGLVGHEQQQDTRSFTLPEPAYALGERRPFGGDASPDDSDAAAIGKRYCAIQRVGSVPAETDRMRGIGYGGGKAIDARCAVQALEQQAPLLLREGIATHQVLRGLRTRRGRAG